MTDALLSEARTRVPEARAEALAFENGDVGLVVACLMLIDTPGCVRLTAMFG